MRLVLAWFALQASYYALAYLWEGPAGFDFVFRAKYAAHLTVVVVHGVSGVVALCSGLLAQGRWHRQAGRVYLAAVLVAGVTGLPMGWWAHGGPLSRAGFLVFDVLWLGTGWLGYRAARARRFGVHRRWMLRNYALTYGAVIVRLGLDGLQSCGLAFDAIYPASSWLAWGSALIVTEVLWVRSGDSWK